MSAQGRWTTRLGLERAQTVNEIALETEPEWRLYEWLRATRQDYRIVLDPPKVQESSNPKGRVWFCLHTGERIRFDGVNGFLRKSVEGQQEYFTLHELIEQHTN